MPSASMPPRRSRGREDYVRGLIEALDNPEPMTPVRAAWILGELRAGDATEELVGSAGRHSDDPEFLSAVVEALGKIADEASVPFMIKLAHSSYLKVRLSAVEALANWKDAEPVAQALRRALHDPNAVVRKAARQALGMGTISSGPDVERDSDAAIDA
jgi:HEAT repeat protein